MAKLCICNITIVYMTSQLHIMKLIAWNQQLLQIRACVWFVYFQRAKLLNVYQHNTVCLYDVLGFERYISSVSFWKSNKYIFFSFIPHKNVVILNKTYSSIYKCGVLQILSFIC